MAFTSRHKREFLEIRWTMTFRRSYLFCKTGSVRRQKWSKIDCWFPQFRSLAVFEMGQTVHFYRCRSSRKFSVCLLLRIIIGVAGKRLKPWENWISTVRYRHISGSLFTNGVNDPTIKDAPAKMCFWPYIQSWPKPWPQYVVVGALFFSTYRRPPFFWPYIQAWFSTSPCGM